MAYTTKLFILFLVFVTFLLGYNYIKMPFFQHQSEEVAQQVSTPTPSADTSTAEDRLLESLSTKEKVAQLLATPLTVSSSTATTSADMEWIEKSQPGFVLIFGRNISTTSAQAVNQELIRTSKDKLLDIAIAVDHEGGTVQRFNGTGFTRLPSWNALCNIQEQQDRTVLLDQSAAELNSVGVDIVLAPVLDTKTPGSFLGSRTCSTDQAITAERAKEFIAAFQEQRIASVIKHFPNIGSVQTDLHLGYDTMSVNYDDFLAFKNILDLYPTIGVMTTHVGVSNQDPDVPCSLSASCLGELKNNYPQAITFTDALDMRSVQGDIASTSAAVSTLPELTSKALQAGNDVVILGEKIQLEEADAVLDELSSKYDNDPSFKLLIDEKVKKVIQYKRSILTNNT